MESAHCFVGIHDTCRGCDCHCHCGYPPPPPGHGALRWTCPGCQREVYEPACICPECRP